MADLQNYGSVYGNLQTGAPDVSKLLGLVQTLQGIQDFRAKQEVGKAYQDATDPETGLTDTSKFMGLVKNNPEAALRAGEAAHQAAALTGQYISNATGGFNLSANQTKFISDLAGSFIGKPGGATERDVAVARTIAARNGIPMTLVDGILANGANDTRTPQQRFQDLNDFALGPAGRSGTATTGIVPSGPNAGAPVTGTTGQAVRQATTPGGTPPIAPQPPGIVTSLPPGAAKSMEGSADAYLSASDAANKYGQRVNPLRQAIPILEGMKESDIGPTSDRWNEIKSTAVSLGAGPLAGIDPEKIKNYNELKKYFSQYSAQAAATLGPKTNDGLATAVTSNPNIHMDKLSALELSKVALGVERMQQAGVLEFNSKLDRGEAGPGDFNKFMIKWATQQDPRAFVYDLMTKDQQDKLKKTLSKGELDKIRNGMAIADRHGLLGDVHQ